MFAQFTANPMRLNWIKALFWCWAVLAILWVLASGWHAYNTTYLHLPFQPQTDCWGPIAKWPDGKPFDEWDRYGAVELDVPSNVEINKKRIRHGQRTQSPKGTDGEKRSGRRLCNG